MKIIRLLEGLYQELKAYNENTRNTNAGLSPQKQMKTPNVEEGKKPEFKTIFGSLMYPGYNSIAVHYPTPTGRTSTYHAFADAELLKELEGCLRASRENEVIGTFHFKDSRLMDYEILGMAKKGTHMKKGGTA